MSTQDHTRPLTTSERRIVALLELRRGRIVPCADFVTLALGYEQAGAQPEITIRAHMTNVRAKRPDLGIATARCQGYYIGDLGPKPKPQRKLSMADLLAAVDAMQRARPSYAAWLARRARAGRAA